MERAEWSDEAGRWTIKVKECVFADADHVTSFVIETMAQSGLPYAADREDCLGQIRRRFADGRVETTFAVTDEDRSRYGKAAEAYLRAYFPDLVEDGDGLLRRIDDTVAEIHRQVEDIQEWADNIRDAASETGRAPYTEQRAESLEGLRDRLRQVLDVVLPRAEERKPTLEQVAAEIREDDFGIPARGANIPRS